MKKKYNLKQILGKPTYEYEKFHMKTFAKKLARNGDSKFWPTEWKEVYFKAYLRFEEIKLPKPEMSNYIGFRKVLESRQSVREFSNKRLSLNKISSFLYFSAGLSPNNKDLQSRRFYPSGGGRFPLEIYLISINSDLPKGIYHYYVKNHSLEKIVEFRKKDLPKISNLKWVGKTGCLIIITAMFRRNTIKYADRGYRHVLSESGHMAQNFYLVATALDLSVCAIGGYLDGSINGILDIDGVSEATIYMLGLGEKK